MPRKRYGKTAGGRVSLVASPAGGWKQNAALRWLLFLLFVGLFYVSLAPRFVPPTYDIRLGAVSDRDIRAPRQEIDEEATIRAREAAAERVQTVFTIVSVRNESLVDDIFRRIDQLNRDEVLAVDEKVDIYRRELPLKLDQHVDNFIQNNRGTDTYSPQLLEEMRRSVLEQKYTIPEETYYKLPRLTSAQIAEMRLVARDVVRQIMSSPLSDAESARTQVAELVNASPLALTIEREIVQELARYAITPNRFADEAATEAARKEAMDSTPPVVIKQGDVIVSKGQVITEDVYALLEKIQPAEGKKDVFAADGRAAHGVSARGRPVRLRTACRGGRRSRPCVDQHALAHAAHHLCAQRPADAPGGPRPRGRLVAARLRGPRRHRQHAGDAAPWQPLGARQFRGLRRAGRRRSQRGAGDAV